MLNRTFRTSYGACFRWDGSERHLATCRAVNFTGNVGGLTAGKEDEDGSEFGWLGGASE